MGYRRPLVFYFATASFFVKGGEHMEKTEVANRLKKAGYQVQFDASVVTVILSTKTNRNQEIKKLHSFFDMIGYHASFGIKQTKRKENDEKIWKEELEEPLKKELQENSEELSVKTGEEEFRKDIETDRKEYIEDEMEEIFPEMEIGEQFSLKDFGIC